MILIRDNSTFTWPDPEGGQPFVLQIKSDSDAINPREDADDNVLSDHLICWHKRYALGDQHNFDDSEEFLTDLAQTLHVMPSRKATDDDPTVKELMQALYPVACILPLWLYDHSGLSISCGSANPFSDPWDSGMLGYAYISKQDMIENRGADEANWREKAEELLKAITETYDQYLRNEVYGYILYHKLPRGGLEELDSCWNFYGDDLMTNGMPESIGCGLMEALHNDDYEEIPDLTDEDIEGPPPMTLYQANQIIAEYGLYVQACPDETTPKWQVSQNPHLLTTALKYDTLEEALNAFLQQD